ncbi:MAG: FeoA family protein [Clostridia bacterium]|nr:FeoA family protein [Clostridia bacterium]
MLLNELKIGKQAKVTAVNGKGILRRRLLDLGITPRTKISVTKIAPMGDPIEITVRGYELTIRIEDAQNIEVELAEDSL